MEQLMCVMSPVSCLCVELLSYGQGWRRDRPSVLWLLAGEVSGCLVSAWSEKHGDATVCVLFQCPELSDIVNVKFCSSVVATVEQGVW